MGGFRIQGTLEGLDKVLANLGQLAKQSTRSKILRKAVNAAARPMLQQARQTVPVDTGWLKKSLAVRIQTYRNTGAVVAVIGPRSGFQKNRKTGKRSRTAFGDKLAAKTNRRPTYYAHLVELGTIKTAARPFLGASFEAQKATALELMRQYIEAGVVAELK